MWKKASWYFIITAFITGFVAFVFGISNAFHVATGEVESKVESTNNNSNIHREEVYMPSSNKDIIFFALGDSLARGTGDENGKGFVGNVIEEVEASLELTVTLYNTAVEGMRSQELVELLKEPSIQEGISKSDVIFLSIGGNDLRRVQQADEINRYEVFNRISDEYINNLETIFTSIRKENPTAMVVFLGLYNLDYSHINFDSTPLVLEWNYITQKFIVTDARSILVPSYDLFKFNGRNFLAPDNLHPNKKGYEAIARRMADVIIPLLKR